jgi:hypothetical protein
MQTGYTVWAYSPSLNEEHRQFDLANMQLEQDERRAQQAADAFAGIYRRDKKQHATDWIGRIKHEQTGIETLSTYLFHTNQPR